MRKLILLGLDLLAIAAAFALSLVIRFGGIHHAESKQWSTLAFSLIFYPLLLYFFDLYNPLIYVRRIKQGYTVVKAWTIFLTGYVFIGFLTKFYGQISSRVFITIFFVLLLAAHITFRMIIAPRLLRWYYRRPSRLPICRFIGPRDKFRQIRKYCDRESLVGFNLIHESDRRGEAPETRFSLLYSQAEGFADLYQEIKNHIRNGKILFVMSPLLAELDLDQEWCELDRWPVYTFNYRTHQKLRDFIRRLIDVAGSLTAIILLLPVFFIIGLAIKIDSPGPVIFKQKRCGKNGRIFTFYKFRSMHDRKQKDKLREVEFKQYIEQQTTKGKVLNHKDITNVGRILRKSSIDEFPQFFNVLKGDMSLIGPRPPIPYEVKYYKEWHRDRLNIKPGLSGLWQIYGRGNMPCDSSIFLDLMYLINRSITLDIRLIFQTIPAVLFGRGAY